MMAHLATCTTCGREIPTGAPGGECPACLLEIALDDGSEPGDPEGPYRIEDLEQLFPSLEIVEYIGRGGMGVVYRAVQRNLDRPVALKILSPEISGDRAFAERFEREARALARLSHPNIVAVHESGRAGDLCYLLMEYVDGVNLRQALRAARLSPQEALAIVPQICDALQYAHDRGVVHRDIKPENVLVDRDGHVKIADFGLAKLVGAEAPLISLTGDQQAMGTAHYIAPEQLRNARDVDHRADIYSLGVVFYEMLTGDIPMGRFQPPSKKVEVDVRLDEVVLRALEQERDLRYQQVSELKSGVERASAPARPAAAPAPAAATPPRPGRVPATAILGILGLPVGVLVGGVAYGSGMRDETAILIAGTVALIGVILSAIARSAIKADPDHLGGLRMATLGVRLPFLLAGLVIVVMGISYFVSRAGIGRRIHDAAEVARVRQQAALVEASARNYLLQIDTLGAGNSPSEVACLFDPASRRVFADTSSEEFRQLYVRRELGLATIDKDRFPEGLRAFTIEQVAVSGDEATVSMHHGSCRITFPMKRSGGEWYLSIGKLETAGLPAAPAGTTEAGFAEALEANKDSRQQIDVTNAVNEYLERIDRFGGMTPLDEIADMFAPEDRARFRSLSDADLRRRMEAGELGLAMIATQSFPDGMAAFLVEDVEVNGAEARVTIHHQGWHIAFPMRRSGGRWYLGLGKVVIEAAAPTSREGR